MTTHPHVPFSAIALAASLFSAAVARADAIIGINTSKTYQRIDGFGATHNTLMFGAAYDEDYLGADNRKKAIEFVYGEAGVNTGGLERLVSEAPDNATDLWGEQANDNADPQVFNWSGFNFLGSTDQANMLVTEAKTQGFSDFYLNPKIVIRWAAPWIQDLRQSDYSSYLEEAAEQVVAAMIHWRDTYNTSPPIVQILNEPTTGNMELGDGTSQPKGTTQEVVDLVKAIGARMRAEGFINTKMVVPNEETVQRSYEVAQAILQDADANQYVGAIGYHTYPYGSEYCSIPQILAASGAGNPPAGPLADRATLLELANQYGVKLWMTEVSHGEVDPRSFDSLRGRAIHIHDEMIYANASAYFGMLNIWEKQAQVEHNPSVEFWSNEGDFVHVDRDMTPSVIPLGMGYAVGHYSRWIERDALRVDASSDNKLVLVTAFKSGDNVTAVLINNDSAAQKTTITVSGIATVGDVSGEQSTEGNLWAPLNGIRADSSGRVVITLPKLSVTTLSTFAAPPIMSTQTGGGADAGVAGDGSGGSGSNGGTGGSNTAGAGSSGGDSSSSKGSGGNSAGSSSGSTSGTPVDGGADEKSMDAAKSGCGCRMMGTSRTEGAPSLLVFGVLWLIRRRRLRGAA